jgi:beta-galactosidase
MQSQMAVQVTSQGLSMGGEVLPLYSGTVHYWRHAATDWERLLDGVLGMGFRYLETYVPWNVHQIEPGNHDFGQIDPSKDIGAFLRLCQAKGLYVLVRPGPHINAELPFLGYPARVLEIPEVQALTSTGAPAAMPFLVTPFVAPSYASERFYTEVATYFDAVAPVLKEYLYPAGPIVAIQSDNEMSFVFRTRCYDLDYNPESIGLYQQLLERKYGNIEALNKAYSVAKPYASFAEVDPPRSFQAETRRDLPYYLDWAEYQEFYIEYGIGRVRDMLEERGLTGVPYFHNYPVMYASSPFRTATLEKVVDIAGIDAYPIPSQYQELKRGVNYTSTLSRLPFIPEFGAGIWAWYRPLSPKQQLFTTLIPFMHGIKGINYYMLADRDRWLACPLRSDGTPRDEYYTIYENWNATLARLEWHKLTVERKALLLTPRSYDLVRHVALEGTFAFQWLLGFYGPLPGELFASESTIGERDAVQRRMPAWLTAMQTGMDALGVAYGLTDSDIDSAKLASYPAVLVPTFDWLDAELMEKLLEYVRGGGRLICGPRWPQTTLEGVTQPEWALDLPPVAKTAGRVNLGAADQAGNGLWLEDTDLWSEVQPGEGGEYQLTPDSEASFVKRVSLGKGEIVLISGAFPEPGHFENPTDAYRQWAPWLGSLLENSGVASLWNCDNPAVDVSVLSSEGRRVVCVANPTADKQQGKLKISGVKSWSYVDIRGESSEKTATSFPWLESNNVPGEPLENGELSLSLDPWTITLWEVK